MHHEGAEAPYGHHEHIQDEDPVDLLTLSPVEAENGKQDIEDEGYTRYE